MWKWIFIIAGIVLLGGIVIVTIISSVNPQGFADFILGIVDEYDVVVDGETMKVKINQFEGGTDVEDRTFLVQKMLALFARITESKEYKEAWEEYSRRFAEMAEDQTLTAEENANLRDLYKDKISDKEIKHWIRKFKEAEDSGEIDSILEELK